MPIQTIPNHGAIQLDLGKFWITNYPKSFFLEPDTTIILSGSTGTASISVDAWQDTIQPDGSMKKAHASVIVPLASPVLLPIDGTIESITIENRCASMRFGDTFEISVPLGTEERPLRMGQLSFAMTETGLLTSWNY